MGAYCDTCYQELFYLRLCESALASRKSHVLTRRATTSHVMRPHFLFSVAWICLSPTSSSASCYVVCTHIQRVVDGMKTDIDRLNAQVGTEMRKMSATLESIASVVVSPPPPSPPAAPSPPGNPCPPHLPPPGPHSPYATTETSRVAWFAKPKIVIWLFAAAYAAFLLCSSGCPFTGRTRVLV